MIEVDKDIKVGDTLFIWYSLTPPQKQQSTNKKPQEIELKVKDMNDKYMRLESNCGYTIMFTTEMISNWYGRFRRVT